MEILSSFGKSPNQRHIGLALAALSRGEVIAVPTETGYCFVGLSSQRSTHEQLLSLRNAHPRQKPFSLLCKDAKQVSGVTQLSTSAFRILNRILPGPFTLILPVHRNTPKNSTGAFRSTVGVRITGNALSEALMAQLDEPLLITSVTDAEELAQEGYTDENFDPALDRWWTSAEGILTHARGHVRLILCSEEPMPMRFSTILDLSIDGQLEIVRDGGWPLKAIEI